MEIQKSTENILPKTDSTTSLENVENFNGLTLNGAKLENKGWLPKSQRHMEKLAGIYLNKTSGWLVVLLLYVYFTWATWYQIKQAYTSVYETTCSGYGFLMILYSLLTFGICYTYLLKPFFLPQAKQHLWIPLEQRTENFKHHRHYFYWSAAFYAAIFAAILIYLIVNAQDDPRRLVPLSGLCIFLVFGYALCPFKSQIAWSTVMWGLILQFTFGLLTIKWSTGRNMFECTAEKITTFLGYAQNGSAFVYGDFLVFEQGVFAFNAINTIFFLAFMINILYYYGIMQSIVSALGEWLQFVMGTSICESVNSAANIFLGMSDAPLLLKPYLADLTDSELHSIMTSGFATVSGTVLAAYISFGANPSHLIISSVMSAPAALCFSKLSYPETETTKINKENVRALEVEYDSVLDAASKGATDAVYLVANILASLIAFIATVYFINGVLSWMGMLVGYTEVEDYWSIELIVGKIFIPISYVMGVPWDECEKVGQLIGLKTMINEFVAFQKMGTMVLSEKAETIATFAICGFANPGSIGITVSCLCALIPSKREVITRLVLRACIGGAVVCFMTACIAGLLIA